jgi:hypothetical protein
LDTLYRPITTVNIAALSTATNRVTEGRFMSGRKGRSRQAKPRSQPQSVTAAPAAAAPVPWWTKPRNWVLTVVGAGLAAAIVPAISAVVTHSATKIATATGVTHAQAPLSWTVSFSNTADNDCHTWTFTKPLTDIPVPGNAVDSYSAEEVGRWVRVVSIITVAPTPSRFKGPRPTM